MAWLGIGVGITDIPVLQHGSGGTPTPTPSIGTPVITQTSTAGANPFTWQTADDPTFQPGDFWHVMRAAANSFPSNSNNIVINGDSWDVDYVGYYAGKWKSLHAGYSITNMAQGGRSINGFGPTDPNSLVYLEPFLTNLRPQIVYTGDAANDLAGYASGTAWAADMRAHWQRVKDANPGVLIVGRTILARQATGAPNVAINAAHNANRPAANTALRAMVTEGFLAGVVDFAANGTIGTDAAMIPAAAGPTCISVDGVHLYDIQGASSGHDIAWPIFAAAMDAVVATMVPLTGEAMQQIQLADLTDTAAIVFADLTATPAGELYLRERVGREDGTGKTTWGAWSNVLHDTIAASSTAQLVTTTGANKSQWIDALGTPPLLAQMNNQLGASCWVKANVPATGKRHFEAKVEGMCTNFANLEIGITDATVTMGPGAVFPIPGNGSDIGISLEIEHGQNHAPVWANGGVIGSFALIGNVAVGDYFIWEFDDAAKTVSIWHSRAGTHLLLTTVTLTSLIPTNWIACVAGSGNAGGTPDAISVNFGSAAFQKAPSAGYSNYG